jgi:sulfatase modifying factor 1
MASARISPSRAFRRGLPNRFIRPLLVRFAYGLFTCGAAVSACSGSCGEPPAAGLPATDASPDGASEDASPIPLDAHIEHPSFADFDCAHAPVAKNCNEGWCSIPAGCFIYGSPPAEWGRGLRNEEQVRVTFTHAFRMQQYEVTQRQWLAQGLPNPSGLMANGTGDCREPDCPVGNVTWFEAISYANLLSKREGFQPCYVVDGCTGGLGEGMDCASVTGTTESIYACTGYRLPTDSEWEYAARAGTLTTFHSGDSRVYAQEICAADPNLERVAWYCYNAGPMTHPVGQKEANAWGLHDMSGNAFEWVNDPAIYSSPEGPVVDPAASVAMASAGATRGGAFNSWSTIVRVANKHAVVRSQRGPGLGFRLVRAIAVE